MKSKIGFKRTYRTLVKIPDNRSQNSLKLGMPEVQGTLCSCSEFIDQVRHPNAGPGNRLFASGAEFNTESF